MKKQFMSTLKSTLAGIALLFICVTANAITKPATGKLTRDEVVKIYIDATISGNVSNLNNVLADDLQFDIQRGDYVSTLDKNQLIDYLKNNATTDLSVKITTTVMQEDDDSSVIKVEFKYEGYSRTDEVTLNKTFGWVITNVVCEFR
jgi:hypothetical protein